MGARGVVAAAVLLALTLLLLIVDAPGFATRQTPLASLRDLSAHDLVSHVKFLSSDLLEGRGASTRGGDLAAEYLATQLALLGYQPAGDAGSYFQRVPLVQSVLVEAETRLAWSGLDRVRGAPFAPRPYADIVVNSDLTAPRVEVSGEIVFVGYGIVAPEYRWDDYGEVDVSGKIVLVMVNEPRAPAAEPMLFGGDEFTYYGRWTYKLEEAARHRAAGVLLIHTDESASYPWQVVESSASGPQYQLEPGQAPLAVRGWIRDDVARDLVGATGRTLEELRRAAQVRGAKPVPLGASLAATVVRRVETKTPSNVIGVRRGADPSQGVLLTAHYDHLGIRSAVAGEAEDTDRIFNGAVDNASGVAGTLALAGALARAPQVPRRSIYVVFTTAEESGLLGSRHLASHPPLPAAAFAANVNIDELNVFGRSRDLVLIGVERSTILDTARQVAARQRRVIATDPNPGNGTFFRSDNFPLTQIGIPAVSIGFPTEFVGADSEAALRRREQFERDYHRPSDEMRDDWNVAGALDDLRLLGELAWMLANDPSMPAYNPGDPFARLRK